MFRFFARRRQARLQRALVSMGVRVLKGDELAASQARVRELQERAWIGY